MGVKKYLIPNSKTVVFEYDRNRVGKITVEAMDALMEMLGAKEVSNDSNNLIWNYQKGAMAETNRRTLNDIKSGKGLSPIKMEGKA